MADHGELAVARLATMNIAVASAHWSLSGAKISARNIDNRFAKRGAPGLVANQRRKDVAFLQKPSASDTDRFLAFADVDSAGDLAVRIKADMLFLECALEQDPTKRIDQSLMNHGFRRRFLG